MPEQYPTHSRVECIDPQHRDFQHAQTVGTVIRYNEGFTLGGSASISEYEIAWDGLERVQTHHAHTVRRVYSEEEMRAMRDQLRTELQHLREDVS